MKIINVGEKFGQFKILSSDRDDGYTKYTCRCLRCGKVFRSGNSTVHKNKDIGCADCVKKEKELREIAEAEKKYLKHEINDLTIIDILGLRNYSTSKNRKMFVRCKCSCGNIVEMPLTRVVSGQAKTCGHDRHKNLGDGLKISNDRHVDGTFLSAIDGGRQINKNNTSGYKGVSYMSKSGKYRAYINFKRKQYFLGCYDDIKQAVAAREAAEKEIYGNFLKWYATEHPEQWEKISKKKI